MQKQTKKKIEIVGVIVIAIIIFLAVYGIAMNVQGRTEEEGKKEQKVEEELNFLDTNLVSMLNSLNNILLEQYKVRTEQGNDEKTSSQTKSEGTGESEGDEKSNEPDANSNSQQGGGESSDSSGGKESGSQTQETQPSKLEDAGILNTDFDNIEWTGLKQQIELLHASWNTIAIDLHSMNVNQDAILQFNTQMQGAIQAIKAEDKAQSLLALANVYALLPQYSEGANQERTRTDIFQTKASILQAYALLEQGNWEGMKEQIVIAQERFMNRMNQISQSVTTQANNNKVYMELKEMETICSLKDKELFLMGYKEVMQILETIE